MSLQEIFDAVIDHLFYQGVQSTDADGEFAYYGVDGNQCAIGIFIPKDQYKTEMEQESIDKVWEMLTQDLTDEQFDLLDALRMVHDDSRYDDLGTHLATVGKDFKLDLECCESHFPH